MHCSGRAQSGHAVTPTRNGRHRPVSGVVVGLEVFADQAWTRSFIYPNPPASPLHPTTTTISAESYRRHQHGVIIPLGLEASNTKVRLAYHARSCRIALPRTYTAQTWLRSETCLILASILPLRVRRRRNTSQSLVNFSRELAELQITFLDRPGCAA